jgi:hypothetical protein
MCHYEGPHPMTRPPGGAGETGLRARMRLLVQKFEHLADNGYGDGYRGAAGFLRAALDEEPK